MKGKLITDGKNNYSLLDYNNELIGTTMESMITNQKLSKQNCDELFGVLDVNKLADEYLEKHFSTGLDTNYIQNIVSDGIKYGFNKAMELNKDKLFTVEDMYEAIRKAKSYDKIPNHEGIIVSFNYLKEEIIQSLQQPTEIEVEIEMHIVPEGWDNKPRLDSEGCLILKNK